MDTRVGHYLESCDAGLRRHRIALIGVAVAVVMGGSFAKMLDPSALAKTPPPTELITGLPAQLADNSYPVFPGGRVPDYVVGTDLTNPNRASVDALPEVQAAYQMLTPGYDDARYGDRRGADDHYVSPLPSAYDHVSNTEETAASAASPDEAVNAAESVEDEPPEAHPALAPG